MLKKIEAVIVWMQIYSCCVVVLSIICASRIYPDGNTENKVIQFLLKHTTIQTAVGDDKWSLKYPFEESGIEVYLKNIKNTEKIIENYCTISFPGVRTINDFVTRYKKDCLHYNIASISSIADNQRYVSSCVKNVLEFQATINSEGIPFFYVQTPSKGGIDFYKKKALIGDDLNIAERSFCLTKSLEDERVDVVNIARDHSDAITFDSSLHWKPADGLDCSKLLAEKLANEYDFTVDMKVYEDDNFYDLAEQYLDAKSTIEQISKYDFSVPCPKNDPFIKLTYAEDELQEGEFKDVIFKNAGVWNLGGGAYHGVFTIFNSLIYSIHNDEASCGKKVLLIGDSFNWPVGSYLSLAVKDVTIIHNASFTGSLLSYVEHMQPDIVIMVYNDAEFYETYTEDAFYLK